LWNIIAITVKKKEKKKHKANQHNRRDPIRLLPLHLVLLLHLRVLVLEAPPPKIQPPLLLRSPPLSLRQS
jgi:hypothetical protein